MFNNIVMKIKQKKTMKWGKYVGVAPCQSMDFTCGDGSCISTKIVCDGYDDCPNAEDELKCGIKINELVFIFYFYITLVAFV